MEHFWTIYAIGFIPAWFILTLISKIIGSPDNDKWETVIEGFVGAVIWPLVAAITPLLILFWIMAQLARKEKDTE